MSLAHLHLMLNHLPVIGAVFGILLLALALTRGSSELGKVALGLFVLLGAATVAVYLTGEPAEDIVKQLPGFSDAITEEHEEVALVATIAMATLGTLALAALGVYRGRALPRRIISGAFAAAIAVGAIMGYTAYLGGQVRHTEIRPGAAAITRGGQTNPADERGER